MSFFLVIIVCCLCPNIMSLVTKHVDILPYLCIDVCPYVETYVFVPIQLWTLQIRGGFNRSDAAFICTAMSRTHTWLYWVGWTIPVDASWIVWVLMYLHGCRLETIHYCTICAVTIWLSICAFSRITLLNHTDNPSCLCIQPTTI